jgi:hypothetical protein
MRVPVCVTKTPCEKETHCTGKRDLTTQAKETLLHRQKRPYYTGKRDLTTQAKETYMLVPVPVLA